MLQMENDDDDDNYNYSDDNDVEHNNINKWYMNVHLVSKKFGRHGKK